MRFLICSDGTDPADNPTRLGAVFAGACKADVTLLAIAEEPGDDQPLRAAIESEAEMLRNARLAPELVIRHGEPIHQILEQTHSASYDLVVIGAPRKRTSGLYWRAERTYEAIKAIPVPVVVATGGRETIKRIIVCTGGKRYIEDAVQLTGRLAQAMNATVTLLHVMAEPPAIYAGMMRLEEDLDALLASGSELGRNLTSQKKALEQLGVTVQIRVRHGLVLDQIFAEVAAADVDLIVTGSSRAGGPLRHYIMGDVTREVVNRASVPVLVARPGASAGSATSLWATIKRAFSSSSAG